MTRDEAKRNLAIVKETFDTLATSGEKINAMGAGAEMTKNAGILWRMFEEAKLAYSLADTSANFWKDIANKCRAALNRIGEPEHRADDLMPSEFVQMCIDAGMMGGVVPAGADLSELDDAVERGELPEWLKREIGGQGDE